MMTPDDKTIAAEDTGSPTEFTSRRQAAQTVMAVGTTVAAGMAVATMPALAAPAAAQAATPLHVPTPPPVQVPRGDLVNVLEYETQARLVLGPAKMAPIAGSDRTVTDRITLRPRMNIPTRDMDLTCTLFGD